MSTAKGRSLNFDPEVYFSAEMGEYSERAELQGGSEMKFDDAFIAKTALGIPTVILWADELPTRRVRFSIGGSVLTDRLGVDSSVRISSRHQTL